jgi:uncharacterized protein TIGR03905
MELTLETIVKMVVEALKQSAGERREYIPRGICAEKISYNIHDGKITNVEFVKGCNGNLKGIARLIEGMEIEQVIDRLKGIDCNGKGTSCPDQLAHALENERKQ